VTFGESHEDMDIATLIKVRNDARWVVEKELGYEGYGLTLKIQCCGFISYSGVIVAVVEQK
jgi:hypothetical protein